MVGLRIWLVGRYKSYRVTAKEGRAKDRVESIVNNYSVMQGGASGKSEP
jgi:hypothetical protein